MKMCDDERRGQDLEPEDAVERRTLQIVASQRIAALVAQGLRDLPQHLHQERAGPTARVEDVDVRVGQAVHDAKRIPQFGIDAGDHVLYDLDRRVPDAQVFPKLGVERFQERLVEVLDGVALLERGEERRPVHPVERRARQCCKDRRDACGGGRGVFLADGQSGSGDVRVRPARAHRAVGTGSPVHEPTLVLWGGRLCA